MKNIMCLLAGYLVCALMGIWKIYLCFAVMYAIFWFLGIKKTLLWEIPMGALSCSILLTLFDNDYTNLLRILIPIAAVIIAYSLPHKLIIFFPVAAYALFLKNAYAVTLIWASLWYGAHLFFLRTTFLKHSIIKQKSLQGNKVD